MTQKGGGGNKNKWITESVFNHWSSTYTEKEKEKERRQPCHITMNMHFLPKFWLKKCKVISFLCQNHPPINSMTSVEKKRLPFSIISLDSTKFQAKKRGKQKVPDHKRVIKIRVNTIDHTECPFCRHFLHNHC